MAENEISEVTKEVLAPEDGPRDNLISTAVKFLQNPKVQSSSLSQRRTFLEKKGLTKEEIELAIDRSGISQTENNTQPSQNPNLSQHHLVTSNPQSQPVPYYPVELSRWEKVRSWTSSALVIAAVAYGGYHFYKNYIRPLILGQSQSERRLSELEKQIQEIRTAANDAMKQIQESLKSIQYVITQQQIANADKTSIKQHDLNSISEIKTEIQSLKGLLLNRRQFPPVPSTSPVLPSWQLTPSNSYTSINQEETTNDRNHKEDLPTSDETQTEVVLKQNDSLTNENELPMILEESSLNVNQNNLSLDVNDLNVFASEEVKNVIEIDITKNTSSVMEVA